MYNIEEHHTKLNTKDIWYAIHRRYATKLQAHSYACIRIHNSRSALGEEHQWSTAMQRKLAPFAKLSTTGQLIIHNQLARIWNTLGIRIDNHATHIDPPLDTPKSTTNKTRTKNKGSTQVREAQPYHSHELLPNPICFMHAQGE